MFSNNCESYKEKLQINISEIQGIFDKAVNKFEKNKPEYTNVLLTELDLELNDLITNTQKVLDSKCVIGDELKIIQPLIQKSKNSIKKLTNNVPKLEKKHKFNELEQILIKIDRILSQPIKFI